MVAVWEELWEAIGEKRETQASLGPYGKRTTDVTPQLPEKYYLTLYPSPQSHVKASNFLSQCSSAGLPGHPQLFIPLTP